MTCREIQRNLIRFNGLQMLTIPNYTPNNWFECDLFEITRAGYAREYEIKLSRSDFKADAEKGRWFYNHETHERQTTKKHDLLRSRDKNGPSLFYFVSPEGLLKLEEIPEWAGWMEAYRYGETISFRETKKAPRLHMKKVSDDIISHIGRVCYFRYRELWLSRPITKKEPLEPIEILETIQPNEPT